MTAPLAPAPTDEPASRPNRAANPAVEPLAPPPPPLEVVRGKEYPAPEAPEGAKTGYLDRLIAATDTDALQRSRKAAYNLLQSNGRMYLGWSARQRRWEDLPLDPNEIRVTLNYIRPILRSRTRRLLPSRIDYQIVPDSAAHDARDKAVVGERFLQARFTQLNLHSKIDQALELSFCAGVSFLKSFWNPSIGAPKAAQLYVTPPAEPSEPQFDENGVEIPPPQPEPVLAYVNEQGEPVENEDDAYWYRPGDTDASVRSVFNVRWNPEARGFTPSDGLRWVLDQEPVPLWVARTLWPEYAEKIQASATADAFLTYEKLAQSATAGGSLTAGTSAAQRPDAQSTMVREYWELPTPHFREGRLITQVGTCVVYDGPFPQGFFPYVAIYDEPAPLSAGGRACVDDMVGPAATINEQWGAILRASKLVGVGQYATIGVPGVPDRITNEDGAVITIPAKAMMGRSIRDVFMKLDQASVPSDRFQIIQQAEKALYNVGSYHEVTQGSTPPGVDSGVAIRSLLEQEEGQLAKAAAALRMSLVELGRQQLKLGIWGYQPGDERWIPVSRPDLGYQIESIDGAKLPDPDRSLLSLEGFRPQSQAELRAEIKEAAANGWIPPETAMRLLEIGRGMSGAFDAEGRHYARARQINLWIERGEVALQPVPGPDGQPMDDPRTPGQPMLQAVGPSGLPLVIPDVDRHALHLEVLAEIILDESKAPEARGLAQQVYAERMEVLRGAVQQQAMGPTPSTGDGPPPSTPHPAA